MDTKRTEVLRKEYSSFFEENDVLGILLFGSQVTGEEHDHSDVDICILKGEKEISSEALLSQIWQRVGGKYDIVIFEDLPLHVKSSIIDNYIVILGDHLEISEYLYKYRKQVNTYRHRLRVAYGG